MSAARLVAVTADAPDWVPPTTWEERLKYALLPGRLSMRRILRKKLRRGERELHLLPFLVDRSRIALDVGAHRGVFTHLLARHCPHVHAFEPNPKNHRWLARHLPANATAHRVALCDETGEARFHLPASRHGWSNQGGSLSDRAAQGEHRTFTVPTQRLDDLDLPPVGFVKIDVEGAETRVLAGGRDLLARDRPALLVEMEERHTGERIEASIARVESLGYAGYFLRDWQLTSVARLDADAEHRAAVGTPGYVFNFLFLRRD